MKLTKMIWLFTLLSCSGQCQLAFPSEVQSIDCNAPQPVLESPADVQSNSQTEKKWLDKIAAGDSSMEKHDYSCALDEYTYALLLAKDDMKDSVKMAQSNVKLGQAYLLWLPHSPEAAEKHFNSALSLSGIDSETEMAAHNGLKQCKKILAKQERQQQQQSNNLARRQYLRNLGVAMSQTGAAISNIAPRGYYPTGSNNYSIMPSQTYYSNGTSAMTYRPLAPGLPSQTYYSNGNSAMTYPSLAPGLPSQTVYSNGASVVTY